MEDWICPKCGMRFVLRTLTGKARAKAHENDGCDVASTVPPPIMATHTHGTQPGVVGKQYPYRKPKPGGH